jgi:hypothetical protein
MFCKKQKNVRENSTRIILMFCNKTNECERNAVPVFSVKLKPLNTDHNFQRGNF